MEMYEVNGVFNDDRNGELSGDVEGSLDGRPNGEFDDGQSGDPENADCPSEATKRTGWEEGYTERRAEGVAGGNTRSLAESIAAAERDMRRENPGFDILGELKNNGDLLGMVAGGLPLGKALQYHGLQAELARQKECMKNAEREAERRVVERLRARNARHDPLPEGGRAKGGVDAMSNSEFREISERVARGEKVYL